MPKRIIEFGDNGPALIEYDGAGTIVVVGATERVELNVTDKEWAAMHKQLKTGKLDFDTVKGKHGINENPVDESTLDTRE
jgi:hypothetical protein